MGNSSYFMETFRDTSACFVRTLYLDSKKSVNFRGTQNGCTAIVTNDTFALNTICSPLGYCFMCRHQTLIPHTNLSCVFRIIFRDFQMFKITSLLEDHVSPEIIFKLPPTYSITSKMRHAQDTLENSCKGWLIVPSCVYIVQAAIPTLGIIQLARIVHNLFLTLEKVTNNIISTPKAQQTSLNPVARAIIDFLSVKK